MATSDLLPTPDAHQRGARKNQNGHQITLQDVVGKSTSSQAVSPASHSLKLDLDVAPPTTGISGQKCLELFDLHNRNGSSLRTLADYLLGKKVWYSSKSVLTWKTQVTKSKRLLFRLSPSTLPTDEIESGLLHTPRAMQIVEDPKKFQERMGDRNSTTYPNLATQIEYHTLLLTPSTVDRGERSEEALQNRIEYRKSIGRNTVPPGSLSEQIATGDLTHLTGTKTGLKLQPNFVAWMMGYPKDWTELTKSKPTETPSSPKSQSKSLKE